MVAPFVIMGYFLSQAAGRLDIPCIEAHAILESESVLECITLLLQAGIVSILSAVSRALVVYLDLLGDGLGNRE
uniref:Uncharacterized protein n=1 Tax=Candidatus Enterococcus clewellii TaxID=1834193 RepID=A0A242K423_9ENTE|nr:hypothetical protein A5888_002378 [Enterococcus sp. 9E7_DIV0242]